ncbi:MAG: glycosyltransferase [Patescibacteria group bacterium]
MDTSRDKRKTKILYVITKSNWGGAQKYVYDLATLLPAGEYDIAVAFGGTGELAEKLREKHIRIAAVPRLGRNIRMIDDVFVFFSLLSLFLRERPNIVHLNSSKIGGLGAFAAQIYNSVQKTKKLLTTHYSLPTKIIFTAHGWPFREERPSWQRLIIRFASWLTIALSHKVIVVSEHDATAGRAMPFTKQKIFCVHNGIRPLQLLSRTDARAEIVKGSAAIIPENAYWVGTNAELTRNKGLAYAVEAMSHLVRDREIKTQFVYVIISDGELKDVLSCLVAELGLGENMFLVGAKKDAARLLSAFDCFLLPSIKEGLPYVLLEAGLARLPTIATHVGGVPEIIKNGETGILVPPKNPRAIADAILLLMHNKKRAAEYGAALSADVKNRFSIDQMIKNTEQLYQK